MKLSYHRHFKKQYRRLAPQLQKKTDKAIQQFIVSPRDPKLRNHPLKGDLLGQRAFSVTSNIRIIFEEHNDYAVVIMLDVGTHAQVYRE